MDRFSRLPTKDPRTIARDIPGISHILFPQLTSSLVASLNKTSNEVSGITSIDESEIQKSNLKPSILFEFSYVIAEDLLKEKTPINFKNCFNKAIQRQQRYYDYSPQKDENIKEIDEVIASKVADNLVTSLKNISLNKKNKIIISSPPIYGYEWIDNGYGDFAIGDTLIEVKCSNKNFSSSDYRQILIYFLLNYIKSLNSSVDYYKELILLNPRLNKVVTCNTDALITTVSAGRSKIEIVQLFSAFFLNDRRRNFDSNL